MLPQMILPKEIVDNMLKKAGLTANSSALGERLAEAIMKETGEAIGINTLKRLLGLYCDERKPHRYTLDTVAHYLGSKTYSRLLEDLKKGNSGFCLMEDVEQVRAEQLQEGSVVLVTYAPDRELEFRYEGDNMFVVDVSVNSKLQVGDRCQITDMVTGFPLQVLSVERDGKLLGRFIAGEKQCGITIKAIK